MARFSRFPNWNTSWPGRNLYFISAMVNQITVNLLFKPRQREASFLSYSATNASSPTLPTMHFAPKIIQEETSPYGQLPVWKAPTPGRLSHLAVQGLHQVFAGGAACDV